MEDRTMRKAALAAAVTLILGSAALAQGSAPSGSPPPDSSQAPSAAPSQDMQPEGGRRGRRGGRRAELQPPAACDQGSPAEIRKCKQGNLRLLQQAINRKVVETCNKQAAAQGSRGPAARDARIDCRYDVMTKLLQSLN
jgi:hypothetical protein